MGKEKRLNSQKIIEKKRADLEEAMSYPHTEGSLIQSITKELAMAYQAEESF